MTDTAENAPKPREAIEARAVTSEELLRGAKMILIHHADSTYRLVVTRSNKLILQK